MTHTPKSAFRASYVLALAKAHNSDPKKYIWKIEDLPTIADKMMVALESGSANVDSPAIRKAAKDCRVVKPTATNIKKFLACASWAEAMVSGVVVSG